MTCPLCGGDSTCLFMTSDRNRRLSHLRFTYRRCERCGAIFLADPPPDLARYYPSNYYEAPTLDELRRQAAAESFRLGFVTRNVAQGHLVEVGAGHGTFAYAARIAGFDVTAVEMDSRSCVYLRDVVGVEAIQSDRPHDSLRDLRPTTAITFWHVLEHLREPWETLEAAAEILEPGGILVVATPNPDALQFRLLRGRWPHIDAPRHLYLIPAPLLAEHARCIGLEPIELTTTDPGGRYWNWFGWRFFLAPARSGRARSFVANGLAHATALTLAPIERRGLNGSTYTSVFRKGAA